MRLFISAAHAFAFLWHPDLAAADRGIRIPASLIQIAERRGLAVDSQIPTCPGSHVDAQLFRLDPLKRVCIVDTLSGALQTEAEREVIAAFAIAYADAVSDLPSEGGVSALGILGGMVAGAVTTSIEGREASDPYLRLPRPPRPVGGDAPYPKEGPTWTETGLAWSKAIGRCEGVAIATWDRLSKSSELSANQKLASRQIIKSLGVATLHPDLDGCSFPLGA